jgi:hypothetical protein
MRVPKRFGLFRIKDTLPGPEKKHSLCSLGVLATVVPKTEPTGSLPFTSAADFVTADDTGTLNANLLARFFF